MNLLLVPIKLLGWTAAGAALAVGWKLGSYVVNSAMCEKVWQDLFGEEKEGRPKAESPGDPEPLWKRRFNKITVE